MLVILEKMMGLLVEVWCRFEGMVDIVMSLF